MSDPPDDPQAPVLPPDWADVVDPDEHVEVKGFVAQVVTINGTTLTLRLVDAKEREANRETVRSTAEADRARR